MNDGCGLLIVDLQYGFAPSPDLVERVRETAEEYAVVVATRFAPNPNNPLMQRLNLPRHEGDAVIDVGHNLVIERPSYGLDTQALDALRAFSEVAEWGLIGGHTGVCLLACAFSLWDAGLPFHVIRPFCFSAPDTTCEAIDTLFQQHFAV